jgi:hypothetical protein
MPEASESYEDKYFGKYEGLMRVIAEVLVEIRASDDLRGSRALADAIHNVPAMILSGYSVTEIEKKILHNAQRLGFKDGVFAEIIARNRQKRIP